MSVCLSQTDVLEFRAAARMLEADFARGNTEITARSHKAAGAPYQRGNRPSRQRTAEDGMETLLGKRAFFCRRFRFSTRPLQINSPELRVPPEHQFHR